jgi:hypothetical protein
MEEDKRIQLSLRFDAYADILEEAKRYCKINRITLTDFVGLCVAKGLQMGLGALQEENNPQESKLDVLQLKFEGMHQELTSTRQLLAEVVERLGKSNREKPKAQ